MTPDELSAAAVKWLAGSATSAETVHAPAVAAAVHEFVLHLPSAPLTPSGVEGEPAVWSARAAQGAVMLTARLIRRRNSTAGVEAFTEAGAVYVSRNDPDVAMLLGLGPFTRPRVG